MTMAYLRFYAAPDDDLLAGVMIELSTVEMFAQVEAVSNAILALLDLLPYRAPSQNDHPAIEIDRRAVNNIIRLATTLESYAPHFIRHRTVIDRDQLEPILRLCSDALHGVQDAKDQRIAKTHEENGKNWGSATGFQIHSYRTLANILEQHTNNNTQEI